MNPSRSPTDLVDRLAQRIDLNAPFPQRVEPPPLTIGDVVDAQAPFAEPVAEAAPPAMDMARLATVEEPAPEAIVVNLEDLGRKGYLTPQANQSLLAEEFRVIKRPLVRAVFNAQRAAGSADHIVMVTSARPAEGKTFTAVNLGISVASERDLQVLLIDGDVRQRGLSRIFGVGDRKGLMDTLTDPKIGLTDVILKTNIPQLSVLPAGQMVESPTELLASQKMQDLIFEISRRYPDHFVIFDSPPVLASTEPAVLAAYAGQVLMVVLANETTKDAIAESLAMLDCRNLNFILNKLTLSSGPDRFGYYDYSAKA